MKRLLFLLCFLSVSVWADELRVPIAPGTMLVLEESKCSSEKVLALISPKSRDFYHDGHLIMPDRTVKFCWRMAPDRANIWVFDEEEDTAVIPLMKLYQGPTI